MAIVELFSASSGPWARPVQDRHQFVTDGPFLHRGEDGALLMVWSSFSRGGYATGWARSATGEIAGPWSHGRRPLWRRDGGHAMLFRALGGGLLLALHSPNRSPFERPLLIPVEERAGGLAVRRGWLLRRLLAKLLPRRRLPVSG